MRLLILFAFVICVASCKPDSATNSMTALEKAKMQLDSAKSVNFANKYLLALRKEMAGTADKSELQPLLEEGLSIAKEYRLRSAEVSFLNPLLRAAPNDPKAEQRLGRLASIMADLGNTEVADILIQGYMEKYGNGSLVSELQPKQTEQITDFDKYMKEKAEKIFEDPDKFGVNRKNAQSYVNACEAFALSMPNDTLAPVLLYRAGEMARTLRTYNKAMDIYDWIITSYPNYEKAPTTLFLKGFMLENELSRKDDAKKVYQEFIQKYPNNDLSDDVNFLLENIDKSSDEIIDMIEK